MDGWNIQSDNRLAIPAMVCNQERYLVPPSAIDAELNNVMNPRKLELDRIINAGMELSIVNAFTPYIVWAPISIMTVILARNKDGAMALMNP